MCNVPCSICGDYPECKIKDETPFTFHVYKLFNYVGTIICTKKMAEEFTLFNPEYSLIIQVQEDDLDSDNL